MAGLGFSGTLGFLSGEAAAGLELLMPEVGVEPSEESVSGRAGLCVLRTI